MTNINNLNHKLIHNNLYVNHSSKNTINNKIMQLKLQSVQSTLLETSMSNIIKILKQNK